MKVAELFTMKKRVRGNKVGVSFMYKLNNQIKTQ